MKMFFGIITLLSLLVLPAYSQYESEDDYEFSERYGEENVDVAHLPEFQDVSDEGVGLDEDLEINEDVNLPDPAVAYE